MGITIHPTAIVDSQAELSDGVEIGPYAIIGSQVKIGPDTIVGPRVLIDGKTTIGARNRFFHAVSIGMPPQDLLFNTETQSFIEIGDDNVLREFVTVHPSKYEGGVTRLHNKTFVMAYAHVAHDCELEDGVIMANSVHLAGHVWIGNNAVLGGSTNVHQFARIGQRAFIGGMSAIRMDVVPYVKANGSPCSLYGMNIIGLQRSGFSRSSISALKRAYKILFRSRLTLPEAIQQADQELGSVSEVQTLLEFARSTKRGLIREHHHG